MISEREWEANMTLRTSRRDFLKTSALGILLMKTGLDAAEEYAAPVDPATGQTVPFIMESAPGAETVINGRTYLYFGGTGYFGLHGNAEMMKAGIEAFKQGTHSGTTRSGFGNNPVLLDVEKKLAAFFGTEEAVYFVSGYFNALFLAQALAPDYDAAFIDETSHFSVRDGIRTTGKPVFVYKHRDPDDLRVRLKAELKAGQRPLVMCDGVFPTFGAIAPVPELIEALKPYDGILALDDAHAVGVLGENGRGTFEHFGVSGSRLYYAGTLSKAFGGHGGFLPASAALIKRVRQSVGAYSGASPTPTPIAAASAKGIELVKAHPEWRRLLRENTARLKSGVRALGFDIKDTTVPIVTWTLKTAEDMKRVQAALMAKGIAVAYLKYVGAPSGGVLRATVFSTHTPAQIDHLLGELKRTL
jgi:glycine C-acetyltransferase/8-amino-7-oxononanoate synthase